MRAACKRLILTQFISFTYVSLLIGSDGSPALGNALPPLQWLRSFEAAARHLSFTAAATEIGITQSAVSQQIKALEQFLGQPLFLRRARSLVLTEAGLSYLPTVHEAFAVLARGTARFLGPDPENTLEIKANNAFSVLWLTPRLPAFLAANPEIEVNLSTTMWEADFTGGPGSVEVRFGRGEWRGETGELLTQARIFPVAAPAVARRIERPEDLAGETLLHLSGLLYDWEHWLASRGAVPLRGRRNHACNTYVLTFNLAQRGLGVAMAHHLLVEEPLADGSLVRLFEGEVPAREGYYLLGPRSGRTNPAARTFCAWLKAQFQDG